LRRPGLEQNFHRSTPSLMNSWSLDFGSLLKKQFFRRLYF
jgi:hypothetical protein